WCVRVCARACVCVCVCSVHACIFTQSVCVRHCAIEASGNESPHEWCGLDATVDYGNHPREPPCCFSVCVCVCVCVSVSVSVSVRERERERERNGEMEEAAGLGGGTSQNRENMRWRDV